MISASQKRICPYAVLKTDPEDRLIASCSIKAIRCPWSVIRLEFPHERYTNCRLYLIKKLGPEKYERLTRIRKALL